MKSLKLLSLVALTLAGLLIAPGLTQAGSKTASGENLTKGRFRVATFSMW